MDTIQQQLTALKDMPLSELEQLWQRYFTRPPLRRRREYLIRNIAYEIQRKQYGGLSKIIVNKLERLAFGEQQTSQPKYNLSPGTQLVRAWNGKCYHVTVTENGFEYENRQYKSLTNIACEITDTRWSGPLFFGLRKQGAHYDKAT